VNDIDEWQKGIEAPQSIQILRMLNIFLLARLLLASLSKRRVEKREGK